MALLKAQQLFLCFVETTVVVLGATECIEQDHVKIASARLPLLLNFDPTTSFFQSCF
jgi:hypothetical protein